MSRANALELAMSELYKKANSAHNKLDQVLGYDAGNPAIGAGEKADIEIAKNLVAEIRTWAREFSDISR